MQQNNCFTSDLILVHENASGKVYQSDRENCLLVDFGGKIAKFSFSCLNRLKQRLNQVNIPEMLTDAAAPDFELITISACDHCYVLSALDILQFQDLINGTFVMFELNHIIKDRLFRLVV